ncbi:beta-lactamase/transpeptidase-like protein [Lindgomyces ingoldianus]|uniref:Beta-lactamase/transpeptidase-like protein n=1 Tax=Lindgomyces ingoldianus TaxID=673940 RepID=A0ACB6R213_9PLEO|nr:beta-lactamase/transpeptidase-like protein [Lindgomyces ingoldianus]KAF2473313.1 beta-lactamase/transpeptidase-like protein [Lindgomyces ingoldianus]
MSTLDSILESSTTDSKNSIPSIVCLAVDSHGTEIYTKVSGNCSLSESAPPVTTDSIFKLASCTKIITTICALRLVARGTFALDDPNIIQTHLPELWALEIVSLDEKQQLNYKPRKNAITLRHLLTHSSGVGYDIIDPRLQAWRKERGEQPMAIQGPLPDAVATPLLFEPGEGWAYGGGLDWVALLIERVAGRKFSDVLKEDVFEIVGCNAGIGFGQAHMAEVGTVVETATRGKNRLEVFNVGEIKSEMGGGSLLASPANFLRIVKDLASATPKLLDNPELDVLFAPQFSPGSQSLEAFHASAPVFTSMIGALTSTLPVTALNHGLGGLLVTENSENLGKTKGTMAWGGAFNCFWFANRDTGVAALYFSSMWPPGDAKSSELMSGFVKEVWDKLS